MDITHLHLHVRDRTRSEAFYARWLGLVYAFGGEGITFMRGERGFLLALMDDRAAAPMPEWFHFGARVESIARLRALQGEMESAGVPIVKPLHEGPTVASFRCTDPDGFVIEMYASPQ